MSKLLDDLSGRYIGVDDNPEYDQMVGGQPLEKLKPCLLCGKPLIKNGKSKYCGRQHYTKCVVCGTRIDIIDKYFRGGFVPKTCCKTCADKVGVETYKQNFMDKYGVTNPMYVPEYADKAAANARSKIPEGKSFAPETRICVICGKEFTRPHISPTQCCSPECSTKLRKQTTAKYKLCELCGKPFIATTSRSKYCDGDHFRLCVICGQPFKLCRPTSTAQVCSNDCKDKLTRQTNLKKYRVEVGSQSYEARQKLSDAFYANHPDKVKDAVSPVVTKLCKICGKEFIPSREHKTICSNPHYRICVVCGKEFEVTKGMGNRTCCSTECTVKKRASTMQDRFGVSSSMESPELRKKAQQTTFKHFGVYHSSQSKEVQKKIKQTCLERYGVDAIAKCEIAKQKSKETCLRKYGVEYVTQTEEFKAKGEKSCLEKYGVRRPMQSREIHQGMWNTRKNIKAEDGTPLDSSWEKLVYDFWKSIGLDVERNIPIQFDYNGKTYTTYVDFQVNGILYEVKGKPYLEGYYSDDNRVTIQQKLQVYREHNVILISDYQVKYMFDPNSVDFISLNCIDLALFEDVAKRGDLPNSFYDKQVRWQIVEDYAQHTIGFISIDDIFDISS